MNMGLSEHNHVGAVLSGIFYAQLPLNSGALLLRDPRGPFPPMFDQAYQVSPLPGAVLLFPSWLRHAVKPTISKVSDGGRISFAFNANADDGLSSDAISSWRLTARAANFGTMSFR